MKSDLANAVNGVSIEDQDNQFLTTHFLAGQHEITELETLITSLQERLAEAQEVSAVIRKTLRERYPAGVNIAVGSALIRIPRLNSTLELVIEKVEVIE